MKNVFVLEYAMPEGGGVNRHMYFTTREEAEKYCEQINRFSHYYDTYFSITELAGVKEATYQPGKTEAEYVLKEAKNQLEFRKDDDPEYHSLAIKNLKEDIEYFENVLSNLK